MSDNSYNYGDLVTAAAASTTTNEIVRRLGREPSPGRNRYVMNLLRKLKIDLRHIDNTPRLYPRAMLADAAASSTSINEVVRRLGAEEVGGTQAHIGRQLRRYGIDLSHFTTPVEARGHRYYDRETLLAAASGATSIVEIVQRLGAGTDVAQYQHVRRRLIEEGLFEARSHKASGRPLSRFTLEEFTTAVAKTRSIAECARQLEVGVGGSFYRYFHATTREHGIDTSHMLGQAHSRGRDSGSRVPPAQVLAWNPALPGRIKSKRLRKAMIDHGIAYTCRECGIGPEWQGRPLTLQADHINGDFTDNRPENLRFLCPNCHATTATYCRKKPRRPRVPSPCPVSEAEAWNM